MHVVFLPFFSFCRMKVGSKCCVNKKLLYRKVLLGNNLGVTTGAALKKKKKKIVTVTITSP